MGITDVLALLGGLALFLYGMQMMSTGLEAAAGNRMKSILEKLTSNRVKGVLVGAAITAVIQSSSATTVMVVGFVNSGLMTLKQAVWVIMGANIGRTWYSFYGNGYDGGGNVAFERVGSVYQSDDEVRQSASRYFGRRAFYGSDPVIFCIGRYFAGACVYRYDPALKRGVRFVRTKHRNMYHGSFGIDRNEGKCKAYDGYPSVI